MIEINHEYDEQFAELAVKVGINVQKGQPVLIRSSVEAFEFVRILVKKCYEAGSGPVSIQWSDSYIQRMSIENNTLEELSKVHNWVIEKNHELVEGKTALISVVSPIPGIMNGVLPEKASALQKASNVEAKEFRNFTMTSTCQWTIIAYPNEAWAMQVFPNEDKETAVKKLWDAILSASRVSTTDNAISEWKRHMQELENHASKMNEYQFDYLEFKNGLGTDLKVGLVKNHIWAGGGEKALSNSAYFAANIPTEEIFCMPDRMNVEGTVVSTKPLEYQGERISDFKLTFQNGKVVSYEAKEGYSALKRLLDTDEGSKHLGEVALISYDSPISKSNILFYNTLFDENASCHLALGNAYVMNLKDASLYSEDEQEKKGMNHSMNHVDFMFGSRDLEVIGVKNGERISVFKNGNFVF